MMSVLADESALTMKGTALVEYPSPAILLIVFLHFFNDLSRKGTLFPGFGLSEIPVVVHGKAEKN